jgi:hypothetical protein
MELELTFPKKSWLSLAAFAAFLILLFLLMIAGKTVTPVPERVLSWQEWRVLKGQRQYAREYHLLRQSAENLAELLKREPDPVRAQLLADSIQSMSGLPALDYQRERLNEAAQAVRNWAVGAVDAKDARSTVEKALESLPIQEIGE